MYLLHLDYGGGVSQTLTFATAFDRALVLIALSSQPVAIRTEET